MAWLCDAARNETPRRPRLSSFVQYIINEKSYELARAFRDLWSLVMFGKFSNF